MTLLGVAAFAVWIGLAAAPAASPSPSPGSTGVFVQMTPDTAQADTLVGIKASCGATNADTATVESDAFGTVTVRPQDGSLTAVATIPADQRAGTYRVRLSCSNSRSATASLHVLNNTEPSRGPATGFGGMAGDDGPASLLITGGLAAVAVGAALGFITLRRRRHGT